ncbi:coronatine-insensitive protein 1-like isoform X2 [Rhododendron vialii]|nr:coronatine-insensitive protein 1-like isoform X2 [Rhododendron vialii]XP_058181821.1 coronatine-insensitive protein 1-like isoform X2 [Rhododendron vialii]XP_058181822.1 coronatine-insensitive protein 1-like isoform X2 [Rhododendron vialii]XP_058181823.1 coronatine-insensitive protein 1-like isoform X2 [Rhododendron vialii]XP_058181824.1 coronatine-insensitive protein 1-like isoform X2 [Rhododendron vialii]
MEQERKETKTMTTAVTAMPDLVFQRVVDYIRDPRDLAAASLVCRRWFSIEASSRKHVTVALCYATTPQALDRRFQNLESLKLKAKPRAAMFNLIPEDWGGHVAPWVEEMVRSFRCLKAVHFRRMLVRDSDILVLAQSRGQDLVELKIDRCSGFSTDGLMHIGRFCKNLTTLFLEESTITERDGEWLHELALNNKNLENLNFYMTDLSKFRFQDLELIARNCPSLVSAKISECELLDLVGFFRIATALQEFGGGSYSEEPERYSSISFPPKVSSLGLTYMGQNEMPIVFPFASLLRRLDLLYAFLDTEDHCLLIQKCPNLEVLETRTVIGDRGLEVLGRCCKRLRKLRIERGADEQGMDNEGGLVSHTGLIALAQGCPELEYLAVYVSDIINASLEFIGMHLKNLCDFRLVLLDQGERISELPLDNGVRALLQGCNKLRRFALYLRPGVLTDVGLGYIGKHTPNVKWMLLGYVGESDAGLLEFSRGCPSLQKLEIRCCIFSEHALAIAALQLTSLRYLWVQGYPASETGHDLLAMARPFWNIELIPARQVIVADPLGEAVVAEDPAHILAYYSLVGRRTDFPDTVVPLEAAALLNE